jgi:hypothetical protein
LWLNLGASKREHAHVRTEEREREGTREEGERQSLQRQPEHPFVMMESDALQSGGAGAQPPQKQWTTMSLRQVHDEFGVGQNTPKVMSSPNSKMKIEALVVGFQQDHDHDRACARSARGARALATARKATSRTPRPGQCPRTVHAQHTSPTTRERKAPPGPTTSRTH